MKRTRLASWLTAMASLGAVTVSGQTPSSVGPFTAGQAEAGRAAYLSNCASCHLPDLAGRICLTYVGTEGPA